MDDNVNETLLYSSVQETTTIEQNEQIEEAVNKENQDNVRKAEWTEGETKLLLDLYEENINRVGPMKRFKNKKNMWQDITNTINEKCTINRTPTQVENRYKTVLKRKKAAVENNIKSGALREIVPFEFELNKIASQDDSIEPEVLGSASGITILKGNNNSPMDAGSLPSTSRQEPSTSSGIKKAVLKVRHRDSLSQTLKTLHKEKEESRERRHREKLNLLKELFKK